MSASAAPPAGRRRLRHDIAAHGRGKKRRPTAGLRDAFPIAAAAVPGEIASGALKPRASQAERIRLRPPVLLAPIPAPDRPPKRDVNAKRRGDKRSRERPDDRSLLPARRSGAGARCGHDRKAQHPRSRRQRPVQIDLPQSDGVDLGGRSPAQFDGRRDGDARSHAAGSARPQRGALRRSGRLSAALLAGPPSPMGSVLFLSTLASMVGADARLGNVVSAFWIVRDAVGRRRF